MGRFSRHQAGCNWFAVLNAETILSSRQRNTRSLRPQQRNSRRELIKSCLRPPLNTVTLEGSLAMRAVLWLGLASLECFRGGCCASQLELRWLISN
jgi:hypothetical protein